MTDVALWYYPVFVGQSREDLDDAVGPAPFKLTAEQMVELLLDSGYAPDVLDASREPLSMPGVTTAVRHEGRMFWVSVDEAAGVIAVQEVTTEAYPDE